MNFSSNMKMLSTWLTLILIVVFFPSSVSSQTRKYEHKDRNYSLDLPSSKWRPIIVSGVAHDSTEFRYNARGLVQLRIRKELVDADISASDLVLRQQRSDRALLPGYVKERYENFEGRLSGAKYPYEYISAGERKAVLVYYLEADTRTIYRLEFTGSPEQLAALSNQTDFIARSFRVQ